MKSQGQALRGIGTVAALAAAAAFSALGGTAGCGSDESSDGEVAGKPGAGGSVGADAGRGGSSGAAGAVSGSAGRVASAGSSSAGSGSAGEGGGDSGGRPAGGAGGAGGGSAASGGSAAGGAAADPCPSTAPTNGAACKVGYQCTYYDCKNAGQVNAFCNGSKVSTEVLPCANIACGATECEPGTICVEHMGGMTTECQQNPCGEHALSCGCVGSLCAVAETCSVSAGSVHCNQ
jgi:hypothetical protein